MTPGCLQSLQMCQWALITYTHEYMWRCVHTTACIYTPPPPPPPTHTHYKYTVVGIGIGPVCWQCHFWHHAVSSQNTEAKATFLLTGLLSPLVVFIIWQSPAVVVFIIWQSPAIVVFIIWQSPAIVVFIIWQSPLLKCLKLKCSCWSGG